jgi:hypothetical protein
MNAPVHYDPISAAWSKPLEDCDVSGPALCQNDIRLVAARFPTIASPNRTCSNVIHGFILMPVRTQA